MERMNLRTLIREELERTMMLKGKSFCDAIQKSIEYLKAFQFKEHKCNDTKEAWKFFNHEGDTVFTVMVIHGGDIWRMVVTVDGKLDKDFRQEIGPHTGFDIFTDESNRRLNNHLMLNPESYIDSADDPKIAMAEKFVDDLRKNGKDLESITSPGLDDIKEIYKIIAARSGKSTKDLVDMLVYKFKTIDNLLLILQNAEKIELYKKIEKYF